MVAINQAAPLSYGQEPTWSVLDLLEANRQLIPCLASLLQIQVPLLNLHLSTAGTREFEVEWSFRESKDQCSQVICSIAGRQET